MRIVGGNLRGKALAAPKDDAIRPTTDRTREALFNILTHTYGQYLDNTRVLDLFAGTGALGLEALSRGAGFTLFLDTNVQARALLRTNIENCALTGKTQVYRRDATNLGVAGAMEPFNLVFADPPYGKGLGELAIVAANKGNWLAPDALVIVEESALANFAVPHGFENLDTRRFGESQMHILKVSS